MKSIAFVVLLLIGTAWASEGDCQGNCPRDDDDGGGIVDVVAEADITTGDIGSDSSALSEAGASSSSESGASASASPVVSQVGPSSTYTRTEAVRVAPAFGTACYESMNASLLDKGFAIGSANKICQSLQIVDVWFALAAVTEDPALASEYTAEGMKLLRKTTRLVNRGLSWHNVKSFFQEIGVPVGIVALLL